MSAALRRAPAYDRSSTPSRPSSMAWHATVPPSIGSASGRSTLQRSLANGQRGWKVQPVGGLIGLGTSPADRRALAAGHVEVGDRVQQHARVGVLRPREQRVGRRHLDQPAEIHHADAVGDVIDDREVVADEQIGEAAAGAAGPSSGSGSAPAPRRRAPRSARRRPGTPDCSPARGRSRCAGAGRRRIRAGTSRRRPASRPTWRSSSPTRLSQIGRCPWPGRRRGSARRRCRTRASAD